MQNTIYVCAEDPTTAEMLPWENSVESLPTWGLGIKEQFGYEYDMTWHSWNQLSSG